LLDLITIGNIGNIEKSIERHEKQNLGQSSKDLNGLHNLLKKENWNQLLRIETAESFIVNFVVKNDTKAVLFDKTLAESIIDTIHKKLINYNFCRRDICNSTSVRK